jgi:HSP20 family protein
MANNLEPAESNEGARGRRPRSSSKQVQTQSLLQDVDRLWDSFIERFGFGPAWPFQGGEQRPAFFAQRPRVDVKERSDDIVVTAEVPGLKPEDLDIEITNDVLTLRADQSKQAETDENGFYRREIVRGSFVRQIRLPCPVDIERAKADYRDGMLTVTMPKGSQARGRKLSLSQSSGRSTTNEASDRNDAESSKTH